MKTMAVCLLCALSTNQSIQANEVLALIPMLPVKLNPSRSLPGFTVSYSMPNASSRVIEMEVTSRLEAMLARIRGVEKMSSTSGNGYGSITIDLDKHTDVDAVRFEASTIIRQTWSELPDGVSYPVIQMKVPERDAQRPFLSFTLNAPSTPILIQQYAEEHIKPRLARLDGVYKVEINGATPMEWQLEYDSEQLRRLGVTIQDITQAVEVADNGFALPWCPKAVPLTLMRPLFLSPLLMVRFSGWTNWSR